MNSQQLLKKYGLHPKKSLGQNFLTDPVHLQKIIEAANLSAGAMVLEIGPGFGALTAPLTRVAGAVAAVEVDAAMVAALSAEVKAPNLKVVQADILAVDPAQVLAGAFAQFTPGDPYAVVANLPYYITSAIIRHLLEAPHPPQTITITIQKEVAERIAARPGDMSLLAVSVQFYGQPTICHVIPAEAFEPSPKVDSAVLRIDRHAVAPVAVEDVAFYFRVVKAGFSQKRKQLKNSLAAGMHLSQPQAGEWLEACGIDPRRRAETLSLAEWAGLAAQFGRLKP